MSSCPSFPPQCKDEALCSGQKGGFGSTKVFLPLILFYSVIHKVFPSLAFAPRSCPKAPIGCPVFGTCTVSVSADQSKGAANVHFAGEALLNSIDWAARTQESVTVVEAGYKLNYEPVFKTLLFQAPKTLLSCKWTAKSSFLLKSLSCKHDLRN